MDGSTEAESAFQVRQILKTVAALEHNNGERQVECSDGRGGK
jgi:hypothetical protein